MFDGGNKTTSRVTKDVMIQSVLARNTDHQFYTKAALNMFHINHLCYQRYFWLKLA